MQMTINVPDQIVKDAQARGIAPELYAEQVMLDRVDPFADGKSLESIRAAADRMKQRSRGRHLDGLSIKQMVQEGRKY